MNKKAFTLIELLAVIVILAIIALIAVPIVINIINDSKKESLSRSIDLYIDQVGKAVTKYQMTHPGFNPDRCEIQSNGNLKCKEVEIEVEMEGNKPTAGTITFNDNKITYSGVVLENTQYTLNEEGNKILQDASTLATGSDYKGYYADVDGDGTPDGIIYADLAQSSEAGAQYANSNGAYTYESKTNLNEYIISKEKYTEGKFGKKEIISLKKNKDNPRFYVIALEDFTTEAYTDPKDSSKDYPAYTTYYWYKNANSKMSTYTTDTSVNFGAGYANTGKIIEIWNKNGTGTGSYVGAMQDNRDIFKHIQAKYQQGWYIPSREEWAAFAGYFTTNTDLETKLTSTNYNNTYGLSWGYLSSSQSTDFLIWRVDFSAGRMGSANVYNSAYVRLGITF